MFFRKKQTPEDKLKKAVPIKIDAADKRYSALFSMDKQPGRPTDNLISLALSCISEATNINLSDIAARIKKGNTNYIDIYPGEHYKLLGAIVKKLSPSVVIELGTHLGYSALCMKKFLPPGGAIYTFDVIPWNKFGDTILKESDFDNSLFQFTDDLTIPENIEKHRSLLERADIIFLDAMKDGQQEYHFLKNLSAIGFKKKCYFIFDDIRLWNMLDIWYNMDKPKLDLTSFGHWSGTGLVEWT